MKCLVESSVELRGRYEDAGHNAQMYLAEWLEPRAQHSGVSGGSGDQGGKTRFAYLLRMILIGSSGPNCSPI